MLKILEIRENLVADLSPLSELMELKDLYLDGNKVKSIDPLKKLTNLIHPYLSDNDITEIRVLERLSKLKTLDLNSNKIKSLKGIAKAYALESISIAHNEISTLEELRSLPELGLTNIQFSGNPLPKYVYEDRLNQELILSYLSSNILDAITQYYGEGRLYTDPMILSIEKQNGKFKLKVRIETFVGAHNPPYGIETITITQDFSGINVEDFKHEDVVI